MRGFVALTLTIVTVVALIILVQVVQVLGDWLAKRADKRDRH